MVNSLSYKELVCITLDTLPAYNRDFCLKADIIDDVFSFDDGLGNYECLWHESSKPYENSLWIAYL